ncbi:integrase [Aphanothece minutissima]|uniref:Integrase n=1 Tax=Aphanothece cf. minutissima CCALA 015 TaxID=2107695 RepID=A0ABX5F8M3_9CHRO|nr:integrase [Aphanothece minutissima]PSB37931.1 integrase [Aphanothece cf. minutissima CCALA 015]
MPATRKPAWISALRHLLKTEHGYGWSIREHRGKVQLTRRFEDGSRSSVSLDLPWDASCQSGVVQAIGEIRQRMEAQGLSLGEAHALVYSAPTAVAGRLDWDVVVKKFMDSREGLRATTLRDLRTRMKRTLQVLQAAPRPRDGRSLMRAYAAAHFGACPVGGVGRKRQMLDVAALLRFAVTRAGAPDRWLPPLADEIEALIGHADRHHEDSMPIKPEQLAALLDALKEAGKEELHLAVALVGLFGLRPAELGVLRVEEGRLYVGSVKRNARTLKVSKPDRRVLPLDLLGREGEGARASALLESGLVKLPTAIRSQASAGSYKGVGDAFRQLLDRFPFWRSMAKATPGLTPYSLRHGYAWRGHKAYVRPIPVRDLAALMGHNPATHHRHYGKWTDEAGLEEAVARATGKSESSAVVSW